jgi:ribosome-associated protein
VVVLTIGEAVSYTDFFVIATGNTPRQTRAIADEIQRRLKERHVRPARVEGESDGDWILLDYLDAVVHVFTPAARGFYRLETLWGDVSRVEVADDDEEESSLAGQSQLGA